MESTKQGQLEAINRQIKSRLLLDIQIDAPLLLIPIDEHSSWQLELGFIQLNGIDSQYDLILRNLEFIYQGRDQQ